MEDPTAKGQDETGTVGTGEYRYMDNGKQFLPGDVPSTPMGLFNTCEHGHLLRQSPGQVRGAPSRCLEALKPAPLLQLSVSRAFETAWIASSATRSTPGGRAALAWRDRAAAMSRRPALRPASATAR